jgi:hypothetical protein
VINIFPTQKRVTYFAYEPLIHVFSKIREVQKKPTVSYSIHWKVNGATILSV